MNEQHSARSTETLSHFSDEPIVAVHSVDQKWRYGEPSEHEKPKGLWLSVDGEDDWASPASRGACRKRQHSAMP